MSRIKLLYAMGGNMHRAGAETMIMNYIRELVQYDLFDITVLVHGYETGDYDTELMSMDVKIVRVPVRSSNPFQYKQIVKNVLASDKYDIVHCNMDASSGDFLEIAKKVNIPVRIVHSHTTKYLSQNVIKKIISFNSKRKINKVANHFLACSKKAGDWMFKNKEYVVVNNAINIDKYRYNELKREKMRNDLQIDSDYVVLGHIGRFCFEKNHEKLIEIFWEYHKYNKKSILLCIGDGPTKKAVESLVKQFKIENSVQFLGVRSDISELMQAMDIFLLPSLFEGLPLVGIEAQAAGLPCIFSEAITQEVCLLDNCERLSLERLNDWLIEIERLRKHRNLDVSSLEKAGFSIQSEANKLKEYYLRCINA